MTAGRPASLMAAILLSGMACSPATSGIQGIFCTADSDCNSGLKCLEFDPPPDGGTDAGCISSGKRCLTPCTTNAECANAGPGLTCVAGCTGVPACVPESDVVPLGDAASDAVTE
jgi:hypothetical protein